MRSECAGKSQYHSGDGQPNSTTCDQAKDVRGTLDSFLATNDASSIFNLWLPTAVPDDPVRHRPARACASA